METEKIYVEKPPGVQTSIKITDWERLLRDAAKIYIKTDAGTGVKNGDFYALAGAEKATKMLKAKGLYDKIHSNYVEEFGPVKEFHTDDNNGGGGDVTRDELYAEGKGVPGQK